MGLIWYMMMMMMMMIYMYEYLCCFCATHLLLLYDMMDLAVYGVFAHICEQHEDIDIALQLPIRSLITSYIPWR